MNKIEKIQDESILVSIITVVYNGKRYLEDTIKSVISQDYKNIEYIIIDGCSEDGTVEIIEKYKDRISYWVSEKDEGIYDAMNKGVKLARGQFLNFMNAGDYFYDKMVVSDFARIMKEENLIVCGDTIIKYSDGFKRINKFRLNLYVMPTYHQSMFFHRDVFDKFGYYNHKYIFGADIDLWQRVYLKAKEKIVGKDRVVSVNNLDGLTNTKFLKAYREELVISYNNLFFGKFMIAFFIKSAKLLILIFLNFLRYIGAYNQIIHIRHRFSEVK